ncbi:helix-turn-helix domain-containing protein [Chryseobacterium sp. 52]|uniref:helix-turn-helix domain-containing protein n=1 Tax=Chryseobacterium sp. 52 TaxID=2035213 RepID=UPI000C18460A|nr:helix-turn-helix transcriptional regulator [Chryseobacterium sp. 52]
MKKEKLRNLRIQKGVTQQELADLIATDVSNISRKESGNVGIIWKEWEKFAEYLEVPIADIYEGKQLYNNESIPDENFYKSIIKDLQEYIALLREELKILKNSRK